MSQSERRRVAQCMYVEIELKKKEKKRTFDFESLVLRKFRKITEISHQCQCIYRVCHNPPPVYALGLGWSQHLLYYQSKFYLIQLKNMLGNEKVLFCADPSQGQGQGH